MGKDRRFVTYSLLSLLALFLGGTGQIQASTPNFNFEVSSHHLVLRIDPSRHQIKATDEVAIALKQRGARSVSLLLNAHLKISQMTDLKTKKSLKWVEIPFTEDVTQLDVSIPTATDAFSLSISYEGQIYEPVVKEKALQFVTGDRTSGLISPEGVYLSSESHWYPDRPDTMASFRVEATVPEPFRVVTQGELLSDELRSGFWKSRWLSKLPSESLTLVAGKFAVKSRNVGGIKVSTYFFPDEDKYSEAFLSAAEEYLKTFSGLLGPYPYKKFDIVENFFSSGYGFPSFTLLAPDAIRQGKEFLRPGTLDHEIVHSWWGHYVSYVPGTGNWVEALTTYCANYYYRELRMGEENASKYRKDVLQKYAVLVPRQKDYPLREFEGKTDEMDAQIGYGKGAMVFHMLRRIVGRETFFNTLKEFASRYGGKQAGWKEIQEIFEETSGKGLEDFFSQWLDRPGGPQLKLENVRHKSTGEGYVVSGEVVQEGELYQLPLSVDVNDGVGKRSILLEASKRRNPFSVEVSKMPVSLTIDPHDQIFRILYPGEIVPCLTPLLEDREKIIVIPDREEEEIRTLYLELAKMVKERKGGRIAAEKEVTEEEVRNSSLMLLGGSWKNPLFSKLLSGLPSQVRSKDGFLVVDGSAVDEEDESLLMTYHQPYRPGKWITIYFGRSSAALSRSHFIFYYGWDSYLLFKKGRPTKRGNFPPLHTFLSFRFPAKSQSQNDLTGQLKKAVSYLASPELGGRLPGTPGYRLAERYIAKELEEMGIAPVFQPFTITVRDLEKVSLVLKTHERVERFQAIPLRFSKEAKWEGPFVWLDSSRNDEKRESLSGKAVLLLNVPKDITLAWLSEKIKNLQSRGTSVVAVFVGEEVLDTLSPFITYPSYFPPKIEARFKDLEKWGYPVLRSMEASKVAATAESPAFSVEIPVLVIPYSQAEEEWIKKQVDLSNASLQLTLEFTDVEFRDANIAGIIEGTDPARKEEFLVLGAHYDHSGGDEKTGVYDPGANRNGSGVAALIEIGRSLAEHRKELKRSVLLLFFGGEEWGLCGSRHYVKHPFIPLRQIRAMFSLDSVGGSTGKKEVFLIGSSLYASMAELSRGYLQTVGLEEGPNIDRSAFAYGSDHYPFHQVGVPAVEYFASDEQKLHAQKDTFDSVDFEKLAAITRLVYLTAYEFLTVP